MERAGPNGAGWLASGGLRRARLSSPPGKLSREIERDNLSRVREQQSYRRSEIDHSLDVAASTAPLSPPACLSLSREGGTEGENHNSTAAKAAPARESAAGRCQVCTDVFPCGPRHEAFIGGLPINNGSARKRSDVPVAHGARASGSVESRAQWRWLAGLWRPASGPALASPADKREIARQSRLKAGKVKRRPARPKRERQRESSKSERERDKERVPIQSTARGVRRLSGWLAGCRRC